MKANRKFLHRDEEAVSPVIAVILMVAITVVLAATVYVWVSGFGAQSGTPAKALALSSAGSIVTSTTGTETGSYKDYTVASASSGMKYSDISLTLNGASYTFDESGCIASTFDTNSTWAGCAGSTVRAATALVTAGDTIKLRSATSLSGQTLRVLDPLSNSIMLTLTVS